MYCYSLDSVPPAVHIQKMSVPNNLDIWTYTGPELSIAKRILIPMNCGTESTESGTNSDSIVLIWVSIFKREPYIIFPNM